jgi:prevent-host-death family protein
MTVTTVSSREFNQDTSRAKKAAAEGPVFITDRGKPAHVLLSMEAYLKLTSPQDSIIDSLGLPEGVGDISFEPDRLDLGLRPAEFS